MTLTANLESTQNISPTGHKFLCDGYVIDEMQIQVITNFSPL